MQLISSLLRGGKPPRSVKKSTLKGPAIAGFFFRFSVFIYGLAEGIRRVKNTMKAESVDVMSRL